MMSSNSLTPQFDIREKMTDFPCAFNIETADTVTPGRLKAVISNISNELDVDDDMEEEKIRKKNMLTWALSGPGEEEKAVELNDEVLELTRWNNMAAVGNRVFIMFNSGDEIESKACLKKLEEMKVRRELWTEARAEQAYYYSRLGGVRNLQLSAKLFSEGLEAAPGNALWRYGLGLVYRRMTNTNLYCSSPEKLDVNKYKKMAATCLLTVGEDEEVCYRLRGMAFAQLANLRQYHPFEEDDATFKDMSLGDLCEKALVYGGSDPSVLTHCGRSLKSTDIDKAIEVLEKSVATRRQSIAYHHLGLSYEKKGKLIATGKYPPRPKHTIAPKSKARRQLFASENPRETTAPSNTRPTTSYTETYFKPEACTKVTSDHNVPKAAKHKEKEYHSTLFHPPQCRGLSISKSRRPFQRSLSSTVDFESGQALSYESQAENLRQGHQASNSNHSTHFGRNQRYRSRMPRNRGRGCQYNRSYSDNCGRSGQVQTYIKDPRQGKTLDPNDELVKKALNCYDKAIDISAGQNIPAILSKGLLLRRSSQLKEALKQFNKVTNFTDKSESHRLSAISAYEQAGLCYLELHKTAEEPNTFKEDAEKKLKRAISLAADLASTDPELKTCATDLWDSFRVLDSERHKLPSELERNKTLIQLLKLVRDYNQIVEVVGRIIRENEEVLDDPEFIKSGIQSYLKIMEFENALTFLNMASTRQSLIESDFWMSQTMTDLKEKTLIGAVENRLRHKQGDAKTVFQQLFKFVYGQCAGTDPETVDDTETPGGLKGDVLFVYDTSLDTKDGLSSVSMSVQCLQDVFTKIFGLHNSRNLKGCSDYTDVEYEIQLKWMAKYRVVIVMIGHEDRMYEYFLKNAPYCSDASTLLVINTMTDTSKVPASLKSRPCLSLYEVGGFQATLPEGGWVNTDEFISKVFDDDVEAVMKLFRFLIGKQ